MESEGEGAINRDRLSLKGVPEYYFQSMRSENVSSQRRMSTDQTQKSFSSCVQTLSYGDLEERRGVSQAGG